MGRFKKFVPQSKMLASIMQSGIAIGDFKTNNRIEGESDDYFFCKLLSFSITILH